MRMPSMKRTAVIWTAAALALLAAVLLGLLRTGPGHTAVAWLILKATSGEVVVTGLDGALPNHLHAKTVELRDPGGVWLRAQNVSLDWSALAALGDHISIDRVSSDRISVYRRPKTDASASGEIPRIDIAALALPQIALAAPLAGNPVTLAARGSLHFDSRHDLSADITITRRAGGDSYVAKGAVVQDVANGQFAITEGTDGLLGRLIGLPGLGPINFGGTASGSRAANQLALRLTAGGLRATGTGTISLADRSARVGFDANAPAMTLAPDLGWTNLKATGRFSGSFDAPDVEATLRAAGAAAGGFSATVLTAQVHGHGGLIDVAAKADGVQVPGAAPGLFAGAPVLATLKANLADGSGSARISVTHPLATLAGTAKLRGGQELAAKLTIPDLAPFGAIAGSDMTGSAALTINASRGERTVIALDGGATVRGSSLLARMLGDTALSAHMVMAGADIVQSNLTLDGAGLQSRIGGDRRGGRLDYRVSLALKDLSRLTPGLSGQASLSGRVTGPAGKALVEASGHADMASKGFARQRVAIDLHSVGLPQPVSATFKARGSFDNAPLTLDAALSLRGPVRALRIGGGWKSLALRADLGLSPKDIVGAKATLDIKTLGDLSPFTGMSAGGKAHLTAELSTPGGKTTLTLHGRASDIALTDTQIGLVSMDGAVTNPFTHPMVALDLDATGIASQGWSGQGKANIRGPTDALVLSADGRLLDWRGAPLRIQADAMLDADGQAVSLRHLTAKWRDEDASLTAPARIDYSDGIRLDHLTFAAGGGTIALSGRFSPALAASLSAEGVRAEAISLFWPRISVSGTLGAEAELHGTLASPTGTVTVRARGLRSRAYAISAATSADLDARAALHGDGATLTATLSSGKLGRLTLTGEAPLAADGALDLRLEGRAELAALDPLLTPGGQRLRGTIEIDTVIAGTIGAPRPRGTASLTNGEFQDFGRGIRLRDINATLKAQKDGLHILALSAKAGPGTISGSGTIDTWSAGIPLDLAFRADNARPIASDLVTASITGEAKITGQLEKNVVVTGAITVPRAEVTLPESFPPQVRTLNVRRRGQPLEGSAANGGTMTLDLTVRTTGPVTLRGRGIDADLGGSLAISGSALAPRITGGLQMRQGTFSIAGQTLNFTTGKINFDGTGVRGRIDPALDLAASKSSGGVTATLTVGGYASQPKITLSSTPQLPQDEVLARLLFQKSATQIGPLQLAEGAQALAAIGGLGSGFSPLATLRGGLGLDRLSVGSDDTPAAGTTVEAGKYVSHNVYVGARQGVAGGTQAQVQVDLTKNLKAQATLGTGANASATKGAAAAEDNSGSIGLSYQFEY